MVKTDFIFSKTPNIYFGTRKFMELPSIINKMGKNILLITGSASFRNTIFYKNLMDELNKLGINVYSASVSGEPTPAFVDEMTQKYRKENIDVIVSIGGGSSIDAGKAISAMLPQQGSVIQYLEAKENKTHNGIKVPFIAVPTTSGTGAEATKNAVLSVVGENGYKSSLRHENFMPDVALIDPALTLTCPKAVTAACGLDALTQLLEGYVSTGASPMTDALAISGLEHFKEGFVQALLAGDGDGNGDVGGGGEGEGESEDIEAREHMAYASMLSGIVLANAGLGVVHGYAGVIGGLFDIPHGVVCGTLLAEATKISIEEMLKNSDFYQQALDKYAKASIILSGKPATTVVNDCKVLISKLEEYINISGIKRLGLYGISKSDIPKIASKTSNKSNPIKLNYDQISAVLEKRI